MGRIYDNWERIVVAVLRREQLRELAFNHSRNPSCISDGSSDFNYSFSSTSSSRESIDDEDQFNSDPTNGEIPEKSSGVQGVEQRAASRLPTTKSFKVNSVVESNGKICYMAGARELLILMRRTSQYWQWTTHAASRFSEVSVLHYGRWLDIRGRIETQKLSPKTFYGAYLVFNLTEWSTGLESVKAVVNFFYVESDRDAQERAHTIYLQPLENHQWGSTAVRRVDGWMEVEIGNFYVDGEDKGVEARLLEITSWKAGLIVEGIEFRPMQMESPLVYTIERFQLVAMEDNVDDDEETILALIDAEEDSPISLEGGVDIEGQAVVAEMTNETKEDEIDISLLHEFAQLGVVSPDPMMIQGSKPLNSSSSRSPLVPSEAGQWEKNRLQRIKFEASNLDCSRSVFGINHDRDLEPSIASDDNTLHLESNRFCPDWRLKKNSSLQENGVGVEMMSKLLLPQDEPLLSSLTQGDLFSGGYDCLSELVYVFHGMKRMVEVKDKAIDDLKKKLNKAEVESQLALAAKDSELEELKDIVEVLKSDLEKAQNNAKEKVTKAIEKIKRVERKLENAESRASAAVKNYKNSEELKVEKHKFASKAFTLGVEFCKKQVLEVDPNFDINRIDVKCLEPPSNGS